LENEKNLEEKMEKGGDGRKHSIIINDAKQYSKKKKKQAKKKLQ